jgi:alkanesulfonate monooxygenase SsuD/methylene tetrahydromethanopterin reductase-like flavin-dependent oxidoreductase (luciferase family)
VHHYARQLGSPFPLLAAVAARTEHIEIGTAVIDMRYENPLYVAEDAGSADLISGGRLQFAHLSVKQARDEQAHRESHQAAGSATIYVSILLSTACICCNTSRVFSA